MKSKKEFAVAVATVVIVYVVLGIPYALIAPTQSMLLKRLVVLTVLSAAMLTFWAVRYKQTSHDLETLREQIERKMRGRNESEHDDCTVD